MYSADSAMNRFLAYNEFFSMSKEENESLPGLVARVEDTLQKIRSARSEKLDLSTFEDQLAAMVLIRALPDKFSSFKSTLMMLDDKMSLSSVKEKFLTEERTRASRSSEGAMRVSTGRQQKKQSSSLSAKEMQACFKNPCNHCSRQNHSAWDCLQRAKEIVAHFAPKQKKDSAPAKGASTGKGKGKGKEKARQAEESDSDSEPEVTEFALAMQVLSILQTPALPLFQMQELTGLLTQVPLAI